MLKKIHSKFDGSDDLVLLKEFKERGDLEILGELFQRYMHLVYGVCLKYLENRDDAQDAVMQVFEKLVEEAGRHEIQNFKSWLYVLTKNYCLMQIRSGKTVKRKQDAWEKDQDISVEFYPELHPIDKDSANLDEALEECIDRLKDEQKDCINLFYFQDWSYRQIAEILKMDEKKVKSHLQNAKRNLKICLEEGYEKEGKK